MLRHCSLDIAKGIWPQKNTEMSQIKSYKASMLEALLYKSVNLCTEVTTMVQQFVHCVLFSTAVCRC